MSAEIRSADDFTKLLSSLESKTKEAASTSNPQEQERPQPKFYFVPKNTRTETIAFVDNYFHINKKHASIEQINGHLATQKLPPVEKSFLDSDEFAQICQDRGLPLFHSDPNQIDFRFQLAVTLLCDFSDKRSHAAKLKEAELTTKEWSTFIKIPRYNEFFQDRLNEIWDKDVESRAKTAIVKGIDSGDLAAVKYFHEYTDRYRPQDATIANLSLVISGLLEILAKHVSKEVLQSISREMEQTGFLQLPSAT